MESTVFLPQVLPEEGNVDITAAVYAQRSYGLSWEAGRIRGFVDGTAALRQAVEKLLRTAAGVYPIYGASYGFFYQDLLGSDVDIVRSEVRRRLEAALLADVRVAALADFQTTAAGDALLISFTVVAADGEDVAVEGRIEGL